MVHTSQSVLSGKLILISNAWRLRGVEQRLLSSWYQVQMAEKRGKGVQVTCENQLWYRWPLCCLWDLPWGHWRKLTRVKRCRSAPSLPLPHRHFWCWQQDTEYFLFPVPPVYVDGQTVSPLRFLWTRESYDNSICEWNELLPFSDC